jgi:three-Cys-motif partner protein
MALDTVLYQGRPQALVKHTFLHHYLPALVNKVCSSRDTFAYIDGFAGPWQSVDGEKFSDTSFGIALDAMQSAWVAQNARGRRIKLIAHLVEKSDSSYAQLKVLANRYPTIEVQAHHGSFLEKLPAIVRSIPTDAFTFSFIDPKGISLNLELLTPLLARKPSEVLVNFMFDFVNRFVSHPNAEIIAIMNSLIPGADWRSLLDIAKANQSSPKEREDILIEAFSRGLRAAGQYSFVTSLLVQKPLADRTLYHLVFGTRNPTGLSVFRDSQLKALEAQAAIRSSEKSKARSAKSGQFDFFAGTDTVTLDPSFRDIQDGKKRGRDFALQLIQSSETGMYWSDLWPLVLTKFIVRQSDLGREINQLRKAGVILAPNWPSERKQIPVNGQLLKPVAGDK